MNRLIYSAAVASSFLMATALPSRANTVDLGALPAPISGFSSPSDVTTYDYTTVGDKVIATGKEAYGTFTISGMTLTFTSLGNGAYDFYGTELVHPGSDSLTVTATGGGPSSFYAGELSAVPLPGTLALFIGGLGLLGFVGLNKRRRSPSHLQLS